MRVFLSHSSKDKENYIDIVSRNMNSDDVIIDKHSFIPGRLSKEEMSRLVESCDLFVLFISKNSLLNDNVQFEIDHFSKESFSKNKFIPLIIDEDISYDDERIPDWMRDYNLRYVHKPKKAVAIIEEKIRLLTWENYADIKKRESIFRGRNNLIEKFEKRYHDRSLGKVICYCASGLESIGRTAFLRHCLKKVGKIRESYSFSSFTLGSSDSIEDFIFKINELGVARPVAVDNLLTTCLDEKIEICAQILQTFIENDDVVHIYDNGCIITNKGKISDWFIKVLDKVDATTNGARLVISSTCRNFSISDTHKFWEISVPELSVDERKWLFDAYLDYYKIQLTNEEFEICINWLQGYPQQVFLLSQNLEKNGFAITKENSHDIISFNMNNADHVLAKYLQDVKKIRFLATLASFEFIKIDDILLAFNNDVFYKDFLYELLIYSICIQEGVSNEFIRLNDTIREYLERKRFKKDEHALKIIREKIIIDFKNDEHGIPESSTLYAYINNSIYTGKEIDEKYIFPSHLAKCMQDIYHKRRDDKTVLKIAENLLSRKSFVTDNILKIAHYYLCLALARTKSARVLSEASYLDPADRYFVRGFFYRKSNKWRESIAEFKKTLDERPQHNRAKRELVIAYLRLNEYENAYLLAEELYRKDSSNIHFAHAYFKCLLNKLDNNIERNKELGNLITSINIGDDDIEQSMYTSMCAEYSFFVKNDKDEAYAILNTFLKNNPNDFYTVATLFNISEKCWDIDRMIEYNNILNSIVKDKQQYIDILKRNEILILAHQDIDLALSKIDLLPTNVFSESFKEKLKNDVEKINFNL